MHVAAKPHMHGYVILIHIHLRIHTQSVVADECSDLLVCEDLVVSGEEMHALVCACGELHIYVCMCSQRRICFLSVYARIERHDMSVYARIEL